jgi:ABC-type nickel/cobalt efflux system permease component RcnA
VQLRARRARLHAHTHSHLDGSVHWHAHTHAREDEHLHPHEPRAALPGRALAVGLMHGLAGSAALFLLTLREAPSVPSGLAYIGLFGLGSTLGMAGLSVAIAVPLQLSTRRLTGVRTSLELLLGLLTVGLGLRLIYELVS